MAAPPPRDPKRFQLSDFLWGKVLGEGSYARVVHAQLKSDHHHDYAIKVRGNDDDGDDDEW